MSSEKLTLLFLPVKKQEDGFNCGAYVIAYPTEIVDRNSPIAAPVMRNQFMLSGKRSATFSKSKAR